EMAFETRHDRQCLGPRRPGNSQRAGNPPRFDLETETAQVTRHAAHFSVVTRGARRIRTRVSFPATLIASGAAFIASQTPALSHCKRWPEAIPTIVPSTTPASAFLPGW